MLIFLLVRFIILYLVVLSSINSIFGIYVCAGKLPVMEDILILSKQKDCSPDVIGTKAVVITRDDIEKINIRTIPELLEMVASINLIERGTPGSQTDISIRGSSIDDVRILINGVSVSDPQTGHFVMEISLDVSSKELSRDETQAPVTVNVSRSFGKVKMIFSISNLFNEYYEEFSGWRAFGKWFNIELEYYK